MGGNKNILRLSQILQCSYICDPPRELGLMKIHGKADFTVTACEMVKNDRNCREIPSKYRECGVKTNHVTVKLITAYLCRETKITA